MSEKVLASHMLKTITDVSQLVEAARGVKPRNRTVFYKCAVILTQSLIEATVFIIIERNVKRNPALLKGLTIPDSRKLIPLSGRVLGTVKDLHVVEYYDKQVTLDSIRKDSQRMNKFCLDNNLITQKEFEKLDFAREKRNEIHLQKLTDSSRSYKMSLVEKLSGTLLMMLEKV